MCENRWKIFRPPFTVARELLYSKKKLLQTNLGLITVLGRVPL